MDKNIPDRMRLEFYRNIFTQEMQFALMNRTPKGNFIAKIEWVEMEQYIIEPANPSFVIPYEHGKIPRFIQDFLDNIQRDGMLDSSPHAKMLEGELKATGEHLKDMRSLVFNEAVKYNHAIPEN